MKRLHRCAVVAKAISIRSEEFANIPSQRADRDVSSFVSRRTVATLEFIWSYR
jgi:hypothetical protein